MAKDFSLSDAFVDSYRSKEIPWGYKDAAGNALGEISYLRTYSRMVNEFTGEKETWVDTCRRVIEGMFSIQKRHCRQNHIEWKNDKAQRTAKDAFDRLFNMKWLPAGRGLWAMGAPIVMEDGNSAPLQSCAFISTDESVVAAMTFLFDASMLGVGVGFDAEGANRFDVTRPIGTEHPFVIPDSREGWVDSLRILMLGFIENQGHGVLPEFDYSQIRPAGQPIKRFGGVASGPEPLKRMHAQIRALLEKRVGQKLTMTDIADIGNIIGTCVVAGNVRRSAEIFFVDRNSADFEDFLNLKNYEVNPERQAWGYMSNNSIRVNVGDDLSPLMDGIKLNGEPGLAWMDMTRAYGRLADKPDYKDIRVKGYNPCAEQPLESGETCNLVETFVNNCEDLDDFIQTLKVAYLYGKTVTLLPTKWEKTNTIMQRNRRIGLSASGVADFVDLHGMAALRTQLDTGFKYILELDEKYSEWLCVRESIRHTTMKPSGTISILAGSSPGTHWTPGGEFFIRRITFGKADPLFVALKNAGYTHEDLEYDLNSAVILFPIHSKSKRSSSEVPAYEKIHLAAEIQHWWSDNAVSCTVDFTQEEAETIPTLLAMYDGKLKGISFLPQVDGGAYKHMPYERITKEEFEAMAKDISKVDFSLAYTDGQEAEGEKFCSNDVCEVATETSTLNTGGLIDIAAIRAGAVPTATTMLSPGEIIFSPSDLELLVQDDED